MCVSVCAGNLQRKLNDRASLNSFSHLLKVFLSALITFVLVLSACLLSVCMCVFAQACTHKFKSWGVCMFIHNGVVCEMHNQSETGIHPFPALVSECLGQ